MKKRAIELLLMSIQEKSLISVPLDGDQIIEAVQFALNKELISRTELGNFKLTKTGTDVLASKLRFESLFADES